MKTRNDCEIACDCVKRANVVLHLGLCNFRQEAHNYPQADICSVRPYDHDDTHTHLTRTLAPRPPMTDVGTETAFRLDQCKHFGKSKHLLRSKVS